MSKKLTIELAKRIAIERDGKCLSDVYIKSQAKLNWQCSEKHTWSASLNHIKDKPSWCPYCSGHKTTTSRSLAKVNPKLSKQWHPKKNLPLTPKDVSSGSNKKIWWLCEKGHEWQAMPNTRSKGVGCPFCAGLKVDTLNCLATKNPLLSQEWHPTKNKELTPHQVVAGTHKKVWWLCKKGHEWKASIANRNKGRGCPYCAGKIPSHEHCLATKSPETSKEWHPVLNGKLTPFDVTPSSNKKVWWICKNGHEWQSQVNFKKGCGVCANRIIGPDNNLSILNPDLAKQWHPTRNGDLKPIDVTPGSATKVWWKCLRGHSWQATLVTRHRQGSGCPKCSNQTSKPELRIYAELSGLMHNVKRRVKIHEQEIDVFLADYNLGIEFDGYHYHKRKLKGEKAKNQILSDNGIRLIRVREIPLDRISDNDVFVEQKKLVKNDLDRLLLAISDEVPKSIQSKIQKYIKSAKFQNQSDFQRLLSELPGPGAENSVAAHFSHLVSEWNKEKNDPLVPESFASKSNHIVWWKCHHGHEWKAKIATRTSGVGCPFCSGRRTAPERSLAIRNPDLAEQWHPIKNGKLNPMDVSKGSKKKVWWKCGQGHEWEAVVYSRTTGTGCPDCWEIRRKVAGRNPIPIEKSLAHLNPKAASEWHPTKNGDLSPTQVTVGSNKKIWWQCNVNKDHVWVTSIYNRMRPNGTSCPFCIGRKASAKNNLARSSPELAEQWHPTKNGELTPTQVTPRSSKKVWWQCPESHLHVWETLVSNRVRKKGGGCPFCSGKAVCETNSLASLRPDIASEWHPTKNPELEPTKVTLGSHKKVWWVCDQGHEWEAVVSSRSRGVGCPHCWGIRRKRKN